MMVSFSGRTHAGAGVSVDHATINRVFLKDASQLEEAFHRRKRPV
jgi:transposase-like protein